MSESGKLLCEIRRLGNDPAVLFAASELAKYLKMMTGKAWKVKTYSSTPEKRGIYVGTFSDLQMKKTAKSADSVADTIHVESSEGRAVIAGANPRSVLFAVYRWLEELGCRWLRPGPGGERVPAVPDLFAKVIRIEESPTTRHRCVCVEGSASIEHVIDFVDYAAKRGFNGFFPQFFYSFPIFDRWYAVEKNRAEHRTKFTVSQAAAMMRRVHREVLRRGLMLHTAGHGWTCMAIGLPEKVWHLHGQVPTEDVIPFLAQVDGIRNYSHGGKPLFTQLCYSNPEVQRRIVDAVVGHAARHPGESYLHVWLGDGGNNHCECDACTPHQPSDLYVKILNKIDAEMTRRGLMQKIVFCAYTDLLWAPRKEKIANLQRFLLMFAPISRSYMSSFGEQATKKSATPPLPYRRNGNVLPSSLSANLALVDDWGRAFSGDRIIYEYHFWRQHYNDPAQMRTARILSEDLKALPSLRLSGFVACNVMRMAFPTGIWLEVQGRFLWNDASSFPSIIESYFRDLFGIDGEIVQKYLERLTRLMSHEIIDPSDSKSADKAAVRRALKGWAQVPALVDLFMPLVRKGLRSKDPAIRDAWKLMGQHAWFSKALARLQILIYSRNPSATRAFSAFAANLMARLPELHHVFDTQHCLMMTQHAMAMQGIPFKEYVVVKEK